jgi:hypothetical protein
MYPLSELVSIESLRALEKAQSTIKVATPHFYRVINGVLASEREYQQWLDNGGHAGAR